MYGIESNRHTLPSANYSVTGSLSRYETTNPLICQFYNANPSINFEEVNLFFIKCMTDIINTKSNPDMMKEISSLVLPIYKGELGDKKIEQILNELYPTSEIKNDEIDFMIKREGKPNIIIENKECQKNVNVEDTKHFFKKVNSLNCSGIFLSQYSGITSKTNYNIDLNNGNIIVYVHNVNHDPMKIKVAIDIIDNLSIKLNEIPANKNDCNIQKKILDEINKEYQLFRVQKELTIQFIKEHHKTLLNQIGDIEFTCLDKYLSTKYNNAQKPGIMTCNLCNFYTSYTLKGIAAHKRGCVKKHNHTTHLSKV
jgi:hypothetical protein